MNTNNKSYNYRGVDTIKYNKKPTDSQVIIAERSIDMLEHIDVILGMRKKLETQTPHVI